LPTIDRSAERVIAGAPPRSVRSRAPRGPRQRPGGWPLPGWWEDRSWGSLNEGEISNAAIACRSIHDMLNPWRDRIAVWLGTPPPDLRGIDLKGIEMSVNDVAGAIWDPATIWPSESFAAKVEAESDEISPDVYRVRLGTERHILIL
jgi:hypothetical protein